MKLYKKILLVFVALSCLWVSPTWWIVSFVDGFHDGYNCAQDTFTNPEDRTEGFYDYWLKSSFFFQQGYEEGYKKGAKNYVKEHINVETTNKTNTR